MESQVEVSEAPASMTSFCSCVVGMWRDWTYFDSLSESTFHID